MSWTILVESNSNFSKNFGIFVFRNIEEKGTNDAEKDSNKYGLASVLLNFKKLG